MSQPPQGRRVTRSVSRSARPRPDAPPETQEPDVTTLNIPGTMPNTDANIIQPTPQRGCSFLRDLTADPEDPERDPAEEANPTDDSLAEIEGMTRIISHHAERIMNEPDATATARPGSGVRLTQPRLPNPVSIISEAIKDGLISLQRSNSLEIKRASEPSQRVELVLQDIVIQLRQIELAATDARGNSWHAHQAAQKAEARVDATENTLKEINKVLVAQGTRLSDFGETLNTLEQRTTDTANALEKLTKYLQDLEEKEKEKTGPIPIRIPTQEKGEGEIHQTFEGREESDDEGPFGRSTFVRESTVHPKKDTRTPEGKIRVLNQTTTAGSAIPKEARTKRPDAFTGRKGKEADTYITKLNIYFNDYEEGTFSDERKISAALMNMAPGEATNWAQPLLKKLSAKEDHEFLRSWENFVSAFLLNFSDPVKKEKAVRELSKLTQTRSAQNYATQFRTLIQEVEWNQNALIDRFKEGLKPEVWKELLRMSMYGGDGNLTLEQWIALACHADDMMFANKQMNAKAGTLQPTEDPNPKPAIGKATQFPNFPNKGNKPTPRVTEEEKQRQRKEGLCIKCAKPGHMIKECRGNWIGSSGKGKENTKTYGKAGKDIEDQTTDESEN